MGGDGQFARPGIVDRRIRPDRNLMQGVHPFGQIMEILTVAVIFQLIVFGLVGQSFRQLLAYPQAAAGGMFLAFGFIKAAYPSAPAIVLAVTAEHMVNLVDKVQGVCSVFFIAGPVMQFKIVADGEGIGPQIPLRFPFPQQAGFFGKLSHYLIDNRQVLILFHHISPDCCILPLGIHRFCA